MTVAWGRPIQRHFLIAVYVCIYGQTSAASFLGRFLVKMWCIFICPCVLSIKPISHCLINNSLESYVLPLLLSVKFRHSFNTLLQILGSKRQNLVHNKILTILIKFWAVSLWVGSTIHLISGFRRDSWPVKLGPIRCPETSVNNYHTTPRNIPKERRPGTIHLSPGHHELTVKMKISRSSCRLLQCGNKWIFTTIYRIRKTECNFPAIDYYNITAYFRSWISIRCHAKQMNALAVVRVCWLSRQRW
jgi:hypothetical protein